MIMELFISCRGTPLVLEAAEGALDDVSSTVGDGVESLDPLSGGIFGNDWLGAAGGEDVT